MPDQGHLSSKVRAYMEALSPAAKDMLARAMRSAQLRGGAQLSTEAMLQAVAGFDPGDARAAIATQQVAQSSDLPWGEQIERALFSPVEPFLCDVALRVKQPARIHQASLPAIWIWLKRDLAAGFVEHALMPLNRTLNGDADYVARKLRRGLSPMILKALREADQDAKRWRRLAAQLGGENTLHDLTDVLYLFQREGAIANIAGQLPRVLTSPDQADPTPVLDLIRLAALESQVDLNFITVLLLQRAVSPAVVLAMALRLAHTTDSRLLQESIYGRVVDTVISEVELWVARAEAHIGVPLERYKVIDDIRAYHDLFRQIMLAVMPDNIPSWHRRLSEARRRMSDIVGREIEQLPGLIRRLTRVDALAARANSGFDQATGADAEFGARLLVEARVAIDSLALNDLVTKSRRSVEQTLEVTFEKLLHDYKSQASVDRDMLLKALDCTIRMSATVFGEDYAVLLRKSRDLAVQKAPAKAAG